MGVDMNPSPVKDREAALINALKQLYQGEMTEGALLRHLRKDILGLTQEQYASLVGISRRTLSDIELDRAQLTLSVMSKVYKPLGLKVGLLPRSSALIPKVLLGNSD
ncbi:MAG: XRE family transcriptional regulator [Oceanospirillales bacterium]|nr:MAG: XRE family transcriptional regulator [Oceanospirillales bacterium]